MTSDKNRAGRGWTRLKEESEIDESIVLWHEKLHGFLIKALARANSVFF